MSTALRDVRELEPKQAFKPDLISGFLVFLIALPLCLGISMASGFPPFAGVITAVVGGILGTFIGSAPLTIKGPAAGLIVIVLGAMEEFGGGKLSDPAVAMKAYTLTLSVVVVSGALLALLGILKAGKLGDFFPSAAVHGMLAAIGIIIIAKQAHTALGVAPASKGAIGALLEIPQSIMKANPDIALIGMVSLAILFLWPKLKGVPVLGKVPGAMVVLLLVVPASMMMDLTHEHRVHWGAMMFDVGPKFLIRVPEQLMDVVAHPDWSMVATFMFWKHVVLFTLVAGLESLLSAKAIDSLDPWGRKTNLNKDLIAQGVGNVLTGLIGGLPMISEIVRSSANVNNGGRTKWANFFHGVFLLAFVALVPGLVHLIPLAALAAMLIYTGTRLASPKEFAHALEIGKEQFAIFVTTVFLTLAVDLLAGIAGGVVLKFIFHLARGVSPKRLFSAHVEKREEGEVTVLVVREAAIFSNYLSLAKHLSAVPPGAKLVVDVSDTRLVDHTVLEHFEREKRERSVAGGSFTLRGLEQHKRVSSHPMSACIRPSQLSSNS